MFKRYVHNELEVQATCFDGSEAMMNQLMADYPDKFEIRQSVVGKERRKTLILRDEKRYAAVSPGDYIVIDWYGYFHVCRPTVFGAVYRAVEDEPDAEVLARKLFELNLEQSSKMEFDELDEGHRLMYIEQARLLMDDFIVVRRDSDELF